MRVSITAIVVVMLLMTTAIPGFAGDDEKKKPASSNITPMEMPPFDSNYVPKTVVIDGDTLPAHDQFVPVEEPPKAVEIPEPEYPEKAKKDKIEGVVWIRVLIDKDGKVRDAQVAKMSGTEVGFEEAALRAAYGGKWKPALQNTQPVACWVTYKVEFSLDKKKDKKKDVTDSAKKVGEADIEVPIGPDGVNYEELDYPHGDTPQLISVPDPDYPKEAKEAGVEGSVWVRALVDEQGAVTEAKVEKESPEGHGFGESAMKTAMLGKWTPAMQNNQPVPCWMSYKVEFTLDKKKAEEDK